MGWRLVFFAFDEVVVGYCIGSCRELRVGIFFAPVTTDQPRIFIRGVRDW
jgi:hypothetical protein